jgi:hypothetical protein
LAVAAGLIEQILRNPLAVLSSGNMIPHCRSNLQIVNIKSISLAEPENYIPNGEKRSDL